MALDGIENDGVPEEAQTPFTPNVTGLEHTVLSLGLKQEVVRIFVLPFIAGAEVIYGQLADSTLKSVARETLRILTSAGVERARAKAQEILGIRPTTGEKSRPFNALNDAIADRTALSLIDGTFTETDVNESIILRAAQKTLDLLQPEKVQNAIRRARRILDERPE